MPYDEDLSSDYSTVTEHEIILGTLPETDVACGILTLI